MGIEEVIKWRRHALNIRAGAQIAVESSTELREISKKLSRMQISTEIQKTISTIIDFGVQQLSGC